MVKIIPTNLMIWFLLLLATYLGVFVLGKLARPRVADLVVTSLFGILVRAAQFILLALFTRFLPSPAIPKAIFGLLITGLLALGFIILPFFIYCNDKTLAERILAYGLFFYLGYFLAGFLQAYFCYILPWYCP